MRLSPQRLRVFDDGKDVVEFYEAPRVERAMTIRKNALNYAVTEGPDYLVIDLMRGRQALFSWEAIESLPVVVIHG